MSPIDLEPYILKTILERLLLSGKEEDMYLVGLIQVMLGLNNYDNFSEKNPSIVRFSEEARKKLKEQGYSVIVPLTAQSIKSLRDSGSPFWTIWHQNLGLERIKSLNCEVAINPSELFLPDSNIKNFEEQVAMVEKLSTELQAKIPDVSAIIGEAPDYAELAFNYFSLTGQCLFGRRDKYDYTRTKTRIGSDMAEVGSFNPDQGLVIRAWPPSSRLHYVWVAPLIVPSNYKKLAK